MQTGSKQFNYPTEYQYPVDPICHKIVLALEKHRWDFPGIEVILKDEMAEFDAIAPRKVKSITGPNFHILFHRYQGDAGSNNTAGVSKISINQKEMLLYRAAGPTLFVYVGKNWDEDRYEFLTSTKVMSKAFFRERTYLRYDATSTNGKDGSFTTNNDGETEYSPENHEPTCYKTDEIFKEFVAYLEEKVLKVIT